MIVPWQYWTEENVRLVLAGAGCGALAVGVSQFLRMRSGLLVGILTPVLTFVVTGPWYWPDPSVTRLVVVVSVGLLAGVGFEQLVSVRAPRAFAPLVYLAASGGVWLGVPNNSLATALIGAMLGLVICRHETAPGVGYGLGMGLAWTALIGARFRPWSLDGGLLCLAPLAVWPIVSAGLRRRAVIWAWPIYVVLASVVSFAAARWVGVALDATWWRVALVGLGAGASASLVLWRSSD